MYVLHCASVLHGSVGYFAGKMSCGGVTYVCINIVFLALSVSCGAVCRYGTSDEVVAAYGEKAYFVSRYATCVVVLRSFLSGP